MSGKLLLHSCCGPCSTSVLEDVMKDYEVSVLFYNPNIYPKEEYEKRLLSQRVLCERVGVKLIEGSYDHDLWLKFVKGLEEEKEGGERCEICFTMRLEKTIRLAKELNFDLFSTTLSVSPHKSFRVISQMGNLLEKKVGIKFLGKDFKKGNGFKRSINISKEHSLYRQNYCGCEFSLKKS